MFKIQTLRDKQGLAIAPAVIEAILAAIPAIIHLFGGSDRRQLTSTDWQSLVPFNGTLYNQIRNNLSSRIKYDVDLGNMALFTLAFCVTNGPGLGYSNTDQGHQAFYNELAQERNAMGVSSLSISLPATMISAPDVSDYDQKYITQFSNYFYGSGSSQNGTNISGTTSLGNVIQAGFGGIGNLNLSTILLIGAGIFLFTSMSNKK